ncbi:MAG: matrixin family metalloprotease [Vicinamibacterales bacterium]
MSRRLLALVLLGVACGATMPVHAYLKYGVRVGERTVHVRWAAGTVRYFVTERGGPGVSPSELEGAVSRAFASWAAVPTASIAPQYLGLTIQPPGAADGRSTIGFLDRPDLDRTLGATSFLLDADTGEILESDIFFNTAFDWSAAAAGDAGRVDLESVALHEIGHLLGLGHSAIGETELLPSGNRRVIAAGAVMFPIAFSAGSIAGRTLQPDDIAGISDLYPAAGFRDRTGSISGTVTRGGAGLFGAHVLAINARTGALVSAFTLDGQGRFVIGGLDPGPHIVRVEPLDDADAESFFTGAIETDFAVTYARGLVVAPRGGTSDPVAIQVTAR